jgi:two-component system, cell cycle sensor histidine kinase and response regulator CckA
MKVEEKTMRGEQQLHVTQGMEALGRLAAGVAHNFNNLLTAISGNVELILMDLPEDDPRRGALEEIRRAGSRSAVRTQQLLALGRQQILQPEEMNLDTVVAGTARVLQRLIGNGIECVTLLNPSKGENRAGPGQIQQVILDLGVDAGDAMEVDWRLLVRPWKPEMGESFVLWPSVVPPGTYALLSISETGCGRDRQTPSRIVDPLVPTSGSKEGAGLGLSKGYGIIHQSGGYLAVESEPASGASIKIFFPVAEGSNSPATEATSLAAGSMETILLVRGGGLRGERR